jgi:acyl-CoA:acyl-CoA alkyltransferase
MLYRRVFLDAIGYELAPNVVSSPTLEARLGPLYHTLRLQPGQLMALTGIRERRWWDPGFEMSQGAIRAGLAALEQSNVRGKDLGVVIYAGVCRDGYEPATACSVAHGLSVGPDTAIYDLSNACLGMMNGCLQIADWIEMGRIRAGIVVACESAREIVEATIKRMLKTATMDCFRLSLATLTGGSGAAALLLTDGSFECTGRRHKFLGGVIKTAPEHHRLCHWGFDRSGVPVMETDAAEVLKNGVVLGKKTYEALLDEVGWANEDVSKVICHQVGSSHRDSILSALDIAIEKDFSTYEYLGNVGTVSLPLTAALADARGFLDKGDKVGFLGIGSGLNCLMLGLEW